MMQFLFSRKNHSFSEYLHIGKYTVTTVLDGKHSISPMSDQTSLNFEAELIKSVMIIPDCWQLSFPNFAVFWPTPRLCNETFIIYLNAKILHNSQGQCR